MRFLLIFIWLIFILSCAPTTKEDQAKNWLYYYDLGMSALSAKNYSEAIANFFIATQKAPNEPKVWNSLGIAYMEVFEYEKAESAFRKALEVDKNFTEARLNLGVMYFRKKDYENALREIRTALADEAFPHKHIAFYYLARVYKAIDNQNLYLENLRKATAYNPMFFEAQLELANAYEEMGDYRSALGVYRNLLNNGIRTPQIELSMARLLFYVEDYENAKLFIKRLIENKQADASQRSQAYELLSQILIKEQERLISRKMASAQEEREEPKAEEKTQGRPPKEEPITNQIEPEITEPERKTEHKPVEVQKERVFRIQLGAFSSGDRAKAWKEKLEKELGIKELTIVEQLGIYRVLYGSFKSRAEAEAQVRRLRSYNLYGFIVQD
ncbi:SPOR domain-containing protein [Thermocrinis sp.]|jgi:tetratricopeptide (TPR) repeat protein|uniref:SPOR domain-containing protein n=1 Tax=Thermocrinis sp. TaxID=2024383 RepID=UPI003BFAAB54